MKMRFCASQTVPLTLHFRRALDFLQRPVFDVKTLQKQGAPRWARELHNETHKKGTPGSPLEQQCQNDAKLRPPGPSK